MKALVIYHKGCADGSCAAYAAWKRFGDDGAEYHACQYGDAAPTDDDVRDRAVYIVDFSFPRVELVRIALAAKELVVLDHHKTAQQDLADLPFARFEMAMSGAAMAWQFFADGQVDPHRQNDLPDPVRYVQDRDLWRWALPDSREVSAAMRALGVVEDFKVFDRLPDVQTLVKMGGAILLDNDKTIRAICRGATDMTLDGHEIPVVNSCVFQSEVGERLAIGRPFAAVWFVSKKGETVVSLRSDANGLDVSAICKARGGGGHARAAGFTAHKPWYELFDLPTSLSA